MLVDPTFHCQIRRNLEAYVDDMVIKSKDEKMLLADIAETFDNLKKINMKLNPKKCSFGVEEGKFLGLSGKLAALNRFLAKSAERSLPFFNTLKNITKENKHEYRWTKEAEEAFQQMKNLIMDLPSLTPPWEKETLYAYLAVSAEAVSAVLLTDRKGRQCPVQYVSRTLNEAERNYAPMKKLALSLIHMTRGRVGHETSCHVRPPMWQGLYRRLRSKGHVYDRLLPDLSILWSKADYSFYNDAPYVDAVLRLT
uniref:Reverse transcriptase domain-containing protein n=1 Tax=Tanacetum cinerariifolium TaxID=118510 RepID=A0A6L2K5H0_TANCI|nr:reverse transcriptase domain-containing protein [Tanacetum cinerariifolium]